jgi:hypothetical protein
MDFGARGCGEAHKRGAQPECTSTSAHDHVRSPDTIGRHLWAADRICSVAPGPLDRASSSIPSTRPVGWVERSDTHRRLAGYDGFHPTHSIEPERFPVTPTHSMSLPGLTGQSSTRGRWLLDRPVEPGDDSEAACVNQNENASVVLAASAVAQADKNP